jgi:hypothetical protein
VPLLSVCEYIRVKQSNDFFCVAVKRGLHFAVRTYIICAWQENGVGVFRYNTLAGNRRFIHARLSDDFDACVKSLT